MHNGERSLLHGPDRPVLPWRIVAGGFLHFVLPAYLLVALACCSAGLLSGMPPAALASRLFPFTGWFAAVYLALASVATTAAVLLDPPLRRRRRRRAERSPDAAERRSRQCLADALAAGRATLDPDAVVLLNTIALVHWDHADPLFQAMSADVAQVVSTSTVAQGTVAPERRQEMAAISTDTLTRIVARLQELEAQRARLDEGDLRTVARYIDSRYPALDSAGDSTG